MSLLKNNYIKFFLNALLIIFLCLFQVSAILALPFPFNKINLLIIAIVFVLFIYDFEMAFFWTVLSGLLLDFYAFSSSGANFISLILSLVIINFLFKNFLTDRSLYSFFALSTISLIVYEIGYLLVNFLFFIFGQKEMIIEFGRSFFMNLFYGLLLDWLVVFLVFYIFNFFSKRYKPFFLK